MANDTDSVKVKKGTLMSVGKWGGIILGMLLTAFLGTTAGMEMKAPSPQQVSTATNAATEMAGNSKDMAANIKEMAADGKEMRKDIGEMKNIVAALAKSVELDKAAMWKQIEVLSSENKALRGEIKELQAENKEQDKRLAKLEAERK